MSSPRSDGLLFPVRQRWGWWPPSVEAWQCEWAEMVFGLQWEGECVCVCVYWVYIWSIYIDPNGLNASREGHAVKCAWCIDLLTDRGTAQPATATLRKRSCSCRNGAGEQKGRYSDTVSCSGRKDESYLHDIHETYITVLHPNRLIIGFLPHLCHHKLIYAR